MSVSFFVYSYIYDGVFNSPLIINLTPDKKVFSKVISMFLKIKKENGAQSCDSTLLSVDLRTRDAVFVNIVLYFYIFVNIKQKI